MSRISESSFVFTEDGGSRQVSTASGMRNEGGMTKSEEGYWKEGQAAPLMQNV